MKFNFTTLFSIFLAASVLAVPTPIENDNEIVHEDKREPGHEGHGHREDEDWWKRDPGHEGHYRYENGHHEDKDWRKRVPGHEDPYRYENGHHEDKDW
ncbi:3621_t:CDS:2, partial [Cetraspora pellucida]